MAKLQRGQIARKVITPFQINLVVTMIVGFLTKSPLSQNQWLAFLQDSTATAALITFLALLIGYRTEETEFPDSVVRTRSGSLGEDTNEGDNSR